MSDYSDFSSSASVDPIYLEPLTTVFYVTSSVSLVANLFVCVFHGVMTLYHVPELNRVSLRLIVMACLSGFIYSVFRFAMVISADTLTCSVDTFFVTGTDLASPFCLSMVGVHAVCVLVLNVNDPRRLEKYYYLLIFFYSLVVAVVAVAASPAEYPERYPCWIRYYFGKKTLQEFNWIWYYSLLILPIALSALCSLILLMRYKMERYNFATTSVRYAQNNNPLLAPVIHNRYNVTDPIKTFRNVIIRSTFYTLIPLVSKILTFVTGFANLRGYFLGYQVLVASGVITTLQGFLVSILYFSDPSVVYTIRRCFCYLRKVYVDDYDLPSLKPVETAPQTPPIDNMWMSRYDEDDTWMGDEVRGAAIRLSQVNHDMIAEDTMEDDTNKCPHQHGRITHLCPNLFYQHPKDPYRCRCFAKTMHWFLTTVCRLKPQHDTESTSTLSYHSRPLTISIITGTSVSLTAQESTDKQSSNMSRSPDLKKTSESILVDQAETKKKQPAVQFDELDRIKKKRTPDTSSPIYATSDDNQYLTPWNSKRHQSFSTSDSLLPPLSTPTLSSPMRWDSPRLESTKASDSPASSNRIARKSKKLRHAMLHRHNDSYRGERKATILTHSQPTSILSSPSTTSILSSKPASLEVPKVTEEDIDRLSLLSSATDLTIQGYQPLSAPPRQQQQPDDKLPTLSITLPDASPHEHKEAEIKMATKTTRILSHGVELDPSTIQSLIDWEPTSDFYPARSDRLLMPSDGVGHGWTSLIHIRHAWDQDTSILPFVEHWVKDYLGSRWFVVE